MTTLGRRAKCLPKRSEKGSFPAVAWAPDANPASPGAAGNTVDQNRLKPCWGRPLGLHTELESESKTEIPVYMFFYCWTMAAAGLSIAFLLDRGARRVYGITLCIGGVIGLPQLIYSIHVNHLASGEAMRRFGLFTPAPRFSDFTVPALSLLAVAAVAWWIWKSRSFELVYPWSLVAGGILLSRSRAVSGIFFHEYHYDWLWTPIRLA